MEADVDRPRRGSKRPRRQSRHGLHLGIASDASAARPLMVGVASERLYDPRVDSLARMDLVVDRYELGPIGTNCFVVRASRTTDEAVVVDPGDDAADLRLELARLGARCTAILVTHCHWDHLGGVADLAEGTEAPVYMSADEAQVLERPDEFYAALGVHIRPYSADVRLRGDEELELAGISFETLRVPGHSPGHLAFHAHGCLFSGDVLFSGGIGRTDLPGGDWDTLLASIRLLAERFPPETVVYPGHGPETTLGDELSRNPFLAELRAS